MFNFDFKFTDNTAKALQELERKERKFAEQAGTFLETQAKKNITEFTYEGKNHPGYVDTDRARGSISHTYTVSDDEIVIYTGSNVKYFVYLEVGTGIYASDGKGRKGWWVYVKNGNKSSKNKKTYTEEEAKKIAIILRSKGLEAFATNGIKPSHSLQRAITDNIGTIQTMWIDILKE